MKTVLITGGAKGIGASMVRKFYKEGYHVILHYYRSQEAALKLKQELESSGKNKVMLVQADIKKEEEVKAMFEKINKEYKTLDVVINNASTNQDKDPIEKSQIEFSNTIETILTGTFLVSKYAIKKMSEIKAGTIINIASTNALESYYPMSIDYDAAKAGVVSLTHNFALAYKPWLRVNAIAPGWIETETTKDMELNWKEEEQKKIYQNRFGNPEEVASLAYFLASEEASYINNTIIRIDGGSQNS